MQLAEWHKSYHLCACAERWSATSLGSGWNAFTALVGHDGAPGPYSVVDVDRGDVLFDVAPLPSGRYLALGTTGYVQNPSGESISEAAQPLLVLLNNDGSLAQNLGYIGGARHNQLTHHRASERPLGQQPYTRLSERESLSEESCG